MTELDNDANGDEEDEDVSDRESTSSSVSSDESSHHEDENDDPPDPPISWVEQWLQRVAVLGDSWMSLLVSVLLLGVAIAVKTQLDLPPNIALDDAYHRLGPVPIIDPPVVWELDRKNLHFSEQIKAAYVKDGVIAIRGLLDEALLQRLDAESREILDEDTSPKGPGNQFHTVNHGPLFRKPQSAFSDLAMFSTIPQIVVQLMKLEAPSVDMNASSIRVLRDIFLTKDRDPYICGWHVDDLGFWPATPESVGVNAWVAFDDMEAIGGGFALAVGSHQAPWRHESYEETGASTNFPKEGYQNASDVVARRSGSGTCNLKTAAPHLHQRMEETKRIYPIRRGDVVFHTRWLFHRTVPYENSAQTALDETEPIHRRYSIRYGLGSAVIPPGYGTELSVLWDDENGGRTADEVCRLSGPWYPQVWPKVLPEEVDAMPSLVTEKFPKATKLRDARQSEMKHWLRKLSKEQYRRAYT